MEFKQVVFLSSIIVYGDSAPISVYKMVSKDICPSPDDFGW